MKEKKMSEGKLSEDLAKHLIGQDREKEKGQQAVELKNNLTKTLNEVKDKLIPQKTGELTSGILKDNEVTKYLNRLEIIQKGIVNPESETQYKDLEKELTSIGKEINGKIRTTQRQVPIDSFTSKVKMGLAATLIAGSALFGGYFGYKPVNEREVQERNATIVTEVSENQGINYLRESLNSALGYFDNFIQTFRKHIPSSKAIDTLEQKTIELESLITSEGEYITSLEGEKGRFLASLGTDTQSYTNLGQIQSLVEQLRTSLSLAEEALGDATILPQRVKELEQKLIEAKDVQENVKDELKSIYFLTRERGHKGPNVFPAVSTLEGMTTYLRSLQALEEDVDEIASFLTSEGFSMGNNLVEGTKTIVSNLKTEIGQLNETIEGLSNRPAWDAEWREYLELPEQQKGEHLFRSIEVLKKHSERTGVVAIYEDNIKLSEELKIKLKEKTGWKYLTEEEKVAYKKDLEERIAVGNLERVQGPKELYVLNNGFVWLKHKDRLWHEKGEKMFGPSFQNSEDSIEFEIHRDNHNLYLCKMFNTAIVFGNKEKLSSTYFATKAIFWGTVNDGEKTILGDENDIIIVEGNEQTQESVDRVWYPARVRKAPEGSTKLEDTREFRPSIANTKEILYTHRPTSAVRRLSLLDNSREHIRRFEDRLFSFKIGYSVKETRFELKDIGRLPESVKSEYPNGDKLSVSYKTSRYLTITALPDKIISPYIGIEFPNNGEVYKVPGNDDSNVKIQFGNEVIPGELEILPATIGLSLLNKPDGVYPNGRAYLEMNYQYQYVRGFNIRNQDFDQLTQGSGGIHSLELELGRRWDFDDGSGAIRVFIAAAYSHSNVVFNEKTNLKSTNNVLINPSPSSGKWKSTGQTEGVIVGVNIEF
jgi:hypothetical protein